MWAKVVCPICHGRVHEELAGIRCSNCQTMFEVKQGCVDFAGVDKEAAEKEYYDATYASRSVPSRLSDGEFWHKCDEVWFDRNFSSGQDILSNLGDLHNKTVLCLGNGVSFKELYFAKRGASLWFSDLSINAMLRMKASTSSYLNGRDVEFHAIDAFHLPFEDSSFDVVYGFAFVHHLANKISFLSEVFRVLSQGGVCVFFDDAFSPVWHLSKQTILKPFMRYIHKRRGISPEDLRATMESGFKKREILEWGRAVGFDSDYFFVRRELLLYFFRRSLIKVFDSGLNRPFMHFFASLLGSIDTILGKTLNLYEKNMIHVVWGYRKPKSELS